jgi:hypothetical protein
MVKSMRSESPKALGCQKAPLSLWIAPTLTLISLMILTIQQLEMFNLHQTWPATGLFGISCDDPGDVVDASMELFAK